MLAQSSHGLWATLAIVHTLLLSALLSGLHEDARPVAMHDLRLGGGERLRCVSYAPFHHPGQTPFIEGVVIERQQIEADLGALVKITDCVRLYSVDTGLDQVPALARALGLKVLLGAWVGRDADKNTRELDRALALANAYPDVVRALIVGNEVLLRRERTVEEMRALLAYARARSAVPVTYAEVWEFWLENDTLAEAVDFVTVHILPFWEDEPVDIEQALAHVADTHARVDAHFRGKPILIGETGWPSAGRQRKESRPSRVNQARYIREFVHQAHAQGWDYNLIEAIDQPWKRHLEGTVGGYWGMLAAGSLAPKFPLAGPVAERDSIAPPLSGAAMGVGLALIMFGCGRRESPRQTLRALAAMLAGASTGLVAVLHFEHALLAYRDAIEWISLGTVALAAVLTAMLFARWDGTPLPAADLGWRNAKGKNGGKNDGINDESTKYSHAVADLLAILRGFTLFAAAAAALLLVASDRYRDFPTLLYLTPAAIHGVIGWRRGTHFSRAEKACAIFIAFGVIGRWLPEPANPQAIAWLLTGLALALPVFPAILRAGSSPRPAS
ncbi:MAG: beta-1,6-glucan synthase [Azoarcus sp.]|jgi:glucan 1,3-beta-glucosidase|nr:beta-1,6-glucan synthase [Azoarcus sp.]